MVIFNVIILNTDFVIYIILSHDILRSQLLLFIFYKTSTDFPPMCPNFGLESHVWCGLNLIILCSLICEVSCMTQSLQDYSKSSLRKSFLWPLTLTMWTVSQKCALINAAHLDKWLTGAGVQTPPLLLGWDSSDMFYVSPRLPQWE